MRENKDIIIDAFKSLEQFLIQSKKKNPGVTFVILFFLVFFQILFCLPTHLVVSIIVTTVIGNLLQSYLFLYTTGVISSLLIYMFFGQLGDALLKKFLKDSVVLDVL